MKRIYLIRHAKSSWDSHIVRDHDRPLNERGLADAPLMGELLRNGGHIPDAMLSSTAIRAITTAEAIAAEIGFPHDRIVQLPAIYHADPKDYYRLLHGLDDTIASVFIVGHNPTISEFAWMLTRTPVGNMPTCAVYCAECPVVSWKEFGPGVRAVMVFHEAPKMHRIH